MCTKGDFVVQLVLTGMLVAVAVVLSISVISNDWSGINFQKSPNSNHEDLCNIMGSILRVMDERLSKLAKDNCQQAASKVNKYGRESKVYIKTGMPWKAFNETTKAMQGSMVCIALGFALLWLTIVVSIFTLICKIEKEWRLRIYLYYLVALFVIFLLIFVGLMLTVRDRYSWNAEDQYYDMVIICEHLIGDVSGKTGYCDGKKSAVEGIQALFTKLKSKKKGTPQKEPEVQTFVTLKSAFYYGLLGCILMLIPILFVFLLYICGRRRANTKAPNTGWSLERSRSPSRSRSRSRSPAATKKKRRRQQRADEV